MQELFPTRGEKLGVEADEKMTAVRTAENAGAVLARDGKLVINIACLIDITIAMTDS